MSWKSLVTAGLLCVLATPAFAAPTVDIVPGGTFANGHLNAAGDWVWTVRLSQSNPAVNLTGTGGITTAGSPLAAELLFTTTGGALLAPGTAINATDFDDPNPGRDPGAGWAWLVDTALGGTGDCNSGTLGSCPVGFQINTGTGQIFTAFGSVDYGTDANGKDYLTITTAGPQVGSLSTSVAMSGAYSGDGRIAELNPAWTGGATPAATLNYDDYTGSETRQGQEGDADLNGVTNFFDLQTLLGSYNAPGKWYNGDSTGDDTVDFFDLQSLLGQYNASYSVGPGAGAGGGGGVPEPASVVLALLAGAMFYSRRSR